MACMRIRRSQGHQPIRVIPGGVFFVSVQTDGTIDRVDGPCQLLLGRGVGITVVSDEACRCPGAKGRWKLRFTYPENAPERSLGRLTVAGYIGDVQVAQDEALIKFELRRSVVGGTNIQWPSEEDVTPYVHYFEPEGDLDAPDATITLTEHYNGTDIPIALIDDNLMPSIAYWSALFAGLDVVAGRKIWYTLAIVDSNGSSDYKDIYTEG